MKKTYFLIPIAVFAAIFFFQSSLTNDGPNAWTLLYNNGGRVYLIAVTPSSQNVIYEAGLDSGIYKSTNAGLNWSQVNTGLTYIKVQALAISPSNPSVIYAGTDQLGSPNSGVYKSTNAGASWTLMNNGIVETSIGIQTIVVHPTDPNTAWMTVFDGLVNSTNGVYKTTNGGTNWFASNGGMTIVNVLSLAINPLNPNVLYAGTSYNPSAITPTKIYKTYNGGTNWIEVSNGLPTGTTTGDPVRCLSISTVDTARVFAGLFMNDTLGGAYLTTNGGTLWVKKHNGLSNVAGTLIRNCLIRPGSANEFYVGLDGGGANTRGVWRTTDAGNTWVDFNNAVLINTFTVRGLAFKTLGDSTLYAGASAIGFGVFGYSWPAPLPPPPNRCLLLPTPGVNTNYVSIPNGSGMTGFQTITIEAWVKIGGTTSANTILNKGAASFDYQLGINASSALPFFRGPSVIATATFTMTTAQWTHLAVTSDGTTVIFYKNGVPMTTLTTAVALGSSANEMRIGRGNNDAGSGNIDELRLWNVVRTQSQIATDMCNKWVSNSTTGLIGKWHFDSTYTDSVHGWNGTHVGTVGFDTVTWCPPNGVVPIASEVPKEFRLEQNYPNPFNPTTTIKFSLPKEGYVEIKLYDVLGKEVATLVKDPYKAGVYSVTFDGSRLASGVYFYRIEAGDFRDVKKMVLIK
jgi:hypothetical protein